MKNMENKRLLNVNELCEYINMGKTRAAAWGKAIGADIRLGRRLLFDRVIVDKAIDKLHENKY